MNTVVIISLVVASVVGGLKKLPVWGMLPGPAKVLVPMLLGVIAGIASALAEGKPWVQAIVEGVSGGYIAQAHYATVRGVRKHAVAGVSSKGA